jgi:hypothetical protein
MDKLIREANCREIIRAYAENITEEMVNEAGETREQLRAAILKGLE